jgi:GNAT superfamily N-acetyltransferase
VKIRLAKLSDYSAWLAMVREYNDEILDRADITWRDFFSPNPEAVCLIATIDDKPVAFLQYTFHYMCFNRGKICYVSDLYVDYAVRRQGIARKLMKHMLDMANVYGWWRLYWITEPDNPARALYDELGVAEFVRYHVDRYDN